MSQCSQCGCDVSPKADRCPDCGADLGEPGRNDTDGQTAAGRDTYWNWIKTLLFVFLAAFLLYFLAYLSRIPADVRTSDSSLTGYPLVSALAIIWGLMLITFPLPIAYLISKDKAVLAREYDGITTRHWLTVGAFSLFSFGLYPLWYFYARYKTVDGPPSGKASRGLRRHLDFLSVPANALRAGVSRLGDRVRSDSDTDADSRAPTLRKRAEQTVSEADTARQNGEYEAALTAYERAIDEYDRAKQGYPAGSDLTEALDASLEETREKLRATRAERDQLEEFRHPLRNAESSFQTAIAEHVRRERTAARRDYRQARDQYERALTALDEGERDILADEGGITVPVTTEASRLPERLSDWPHVSDAERKSLAVVGIGTVSELKSASPETIDGLPDREEIDAELATHLHVARWWHGDDERTFTTRGALERQRNRAIDGLELLS